MRHKSSPIWARLIAHKIAKFGSNIILVLPATDRSFELVRALTRRRPCWVIKGQFLESLSLDAPLAEYVRTPAEIVRLTAGCPELGRPVISIPELVVGDGPSFIQTEFLDKLRYFSIIECLLYARHAPHVLSVASRFGHRAYGLQKVHIDASSSIDPVVSCLKSLLLPVETEARLKPTDWCAKDALMAKTQTGFSASLREDCRDIEAILRMMLLYKAGEESHIRGMLGAINGYVENRV